jgi:acyl-CoA reductase-like NAD-dependent aldehyde dehydrogenase
MSNMLEGRLLIDGELVEGEAGWSDSINPADETVIGRASNASAKDVARAVDAAEKAWPAWSERSIEERGEIIREFADKVMARADEIARIEVRDSGNTLRPTLHAMTEIQKTARYYAGIAYMLRGATIPATPDNLHMTVFEPYGVVGRIGAYSHPALFSMARALSALVAGNAVVAKPPETCPHSALAIAEIARDVLPRGVYNVVNGKRSRRRRCARPLPECQAAGADWLGPDRHGDPAIGGGGRCQTRHVGTRRQEPDDRVSRRRSGPRC